MVKFGSAKKGAATLNDLHNYDDLYVGMPVSGRGIPDGAILTAMPTFKNIVDPEDPEKKRMKRVTDKQLTISAPLTEDTLNAVFAFTPLIQAVGTLAKTRRSSKTSPARSTSSRACWSRTPASRPPPRSSR
jgi:hypothetical protein